MSGTSERRMTRGAAEKEKKRKAEEERLEREAKRFDLGQPRHPNDLETNQRFGNKVKIEVPEEEQVVVKEEQDVVVVKEEVDLDIPIENPASGLLLIVETTSERAEDTEVEQEIDSAAEAVSMSVALVEERQMDGKDTDGKGTPEANEIEVPASDLLLSMTSVVASDIDTQSEQREQVSSQSQDLTTCGNKTCSKEIEALRSENLLLKQQLEDRDRKMEEMKLRLHELQQWKEISYTKLVNVHPLVGEENNASVVAGKVLPILISRGFLEMESLLKCRPVCKNWKQEIDTFLDSASIRPFCKIESQLETRRLILNHLPDVSEREMLKIVEKYVFDCPDKLEKFLNAMENFQGNPFLGRTVILQPNQDSVMTDLLEVKKFWELVSTLLSKFGKYLTTVMIIQKISSIWKTDDNSTPLQMYKLLESILVHLENIKRLIVYGNHYFHDDSQFHYPRLTWTQAMEQELSQSMAGKVLPHLPNLCYLRLQFGFETSAILNAILAQSPLLNCLSSEFSLEGSKEWIARLDLKVLTLTSKSKEFINLNLVSTGLGKLDYDFSKNRGEIAIGELLGVLKRFPKLSDLKLTGTISVDKQPPVLQNLSVENLKLCYCYRYCGEGQMIFLDGLFRDLLPGGSYRRILAHFPNLRFVNITERGRWMYSFPADDDDKEPSKVVYTSDIWTELRSLEAVSVTYTQKSWTTYKFSWTRDKYWKFQESQGEMAH